MALALARAGRSSTVLCKSALGEGASTGWAQGGIAAALAPDDSPEQHASDTLAVAGGIADPAAVDLLTREAAAGIDVLLALGVPFDREAGGALALGREAAHNRRRIVHASGDATGRAVLEALVAAARREPAIRIIEHADVRDAIVAGGRVTHVVAQIAGETVALDADALDRDRRIGALFAATTNPLVACGDGLALAARAERGWPISSSSTHPTALAAPGATRCRWSPKRCAAGACWSTTAASASCSPSIRPPNRAARRRRAPISSHLAAGGGRARRARRHRPAAFPQASDRLRAVPRGGIDPRIRT